MRITTLLILSVLMGSFVLLLAEYASDGDSTVAAGQKLFETKCAVCHSVDSPQRKIGPSLQDVKKGKLPSGRNASHKTLLEQLNDGGNGMPTFRELLTDDQKEALIAYVMTL